MILARIVRRRSILAGVALAGAALVLSAALAAPIPSAPPSEKPTDQEKARLTYLHRNTVEIFIDRPGFGYRRLSLNLGDILSPPKSLSEENEKQQLEPTLPVAKEDEKSGKPKAPSHYAIEDAVIAGRAGRILTEDKKEEWKVTKVQLVGLVKQADPLIYTIDKNPKARDESKQPKEVATREADDFEKKALEAIRNGDGLQIAKHGKEMRMFGAIYAGQRCIACHEKGLLLGAFTYKLELVPTRPDSELQAPFARP